MKKLAIGFCLLLVMTFATYIIITQAQNKSNMIDAKSAHAILDSYGKMLESVDVQKLGLPAATDVKDATLTNPYRVSDLPLDKLKAMTKDTSNSIESIITPSSSVYYEIHAKNGEILGLVEVEKKDGQYVAKSFGNKSLSDAITRLRGRNTQYAEQEVAIVRLLAFHLELWQVQSPSGYLFIPMQPVPVLGIEEGVPLTGKELFNKVKTFADNYNGLPM